MIDYRKLQAKVRESGLKGSYIANKMGMSRQVFSNRLHGKTEFKLSEIFKLCNILGIGQADRDVIFFANTVA